MQNFEFINYEQDPDGIVTITLNRPEQLNAMHPDMAGELGAALDLVDADADVRVVILTGAGRAFCAGADLSTGAETFTPRPQDDGDSDQVRDWGGVLALRLFRLSKPVIAAVNGAAVGVGATMTLPCDIRMASTAGRFGFVFARRGIVNDGCASWFLPRIVGIATALKWSLTGSILGAHEALERGLVDSVHEPDDLLPAARALARDIAVNTSAVSVSVIRALLWRGLVEDHPMSLHRHESVLMSFVSASDDAREGVESFLERRPAAFTGRVPSDLPTTWPLWREPTFEADVVVDDA